MGPGFPWGTLTVNVVGCFVIGVFAEMIARRFGASADLRLLLITGFLGGFTTFSAFSLDAISLFERGDLASGADLYDGQCRAVDAGGVCRTGDHPRVF
jgi:CrcB protein